MQTYNDVLAEIQSFSLNGKLRLCHTHRSVELQDFQNVIRIPDQNKYPLICPFSIRDFQIKKYPRFSCGAGILPDNNIRREQMPIPQDWIIFFVAFS
jgi:hypothetical protein